MKDEWTNVIWADRLVKFTYSDLPTGAAFMTAQIAGPRRATSARGCRILARADRGTAVRCCAADRRRPFVRAAGSPAELGAVRCPRSATFRSTRRAALQTLLIQTDGTSKVTKPGRHGHTMPLAPLVVKRPPASMAGDRYIQLRYRVRLAILKHAEMQQVGRAVRPRRNFSNELQLVPRSRSNTITWSNALPAASMPPTVAVSVFSSSDKAYFALPTARPSLVATVSSTCVPIHFVTATTPRACGETACATPSAWSTVVPDSSFPAMLTPACVNETTSPDTSNVSPISGCLTTLEGSGPLKTLRLADREPEDAIGAASLSQPTASSKRKTQRAANGNSHDYLTRSDRTSCVPAL
jgi:hypothetical protein